MMKKKEANSITKSKKTLNNGERFEKFLLNSILFILAKKL